MARYAYFSDVPNLAPDLQSIDAFTIDSALASVHKNRPEICIIPPHLDIVVIIISHQQNIGQTVSICIDDYRVPVRS